MEILSKWHMATIHGRLGTALRYCVSIWMVGQNPWNAILTLEIELRVGAECLPPMSSFIVPPMFPRRELWRQRLCMWAGVAT